VSLLEGCHGGGWAARLVHEWLEHVAGARHRDDARCAHVVDAVVEVVHAARVDDLLPPADRVCIVCDVFLLSLSS